MQCRPECYYDHPVLFLLTANLLFSILTVYQPFYDTSLICFFRRTASFKECVICPTATTITPLHLLPLAPCWLSSGYIWFFNRLKTPQFCCFLSWSNVGIVCFLFGHFPPLCIYHCWYSTSHLLPLLLTTPSWLVRCPEHQILDYSLS
jgi:hypothetical protein